MTVSCLVNVRCNTCIYKILQLFTNGFELLLHTRNTLRSYYMSRRRILMSPNCNQAMNRLRNQPLGMRRTQRWVERCHLVSTEQTWTSITFLFRGWCMDLFCGRLWVLRLDPRKSIKQAVEDAAEKWCVVKVGRINSKRWRRRDLVGEDSNFDTSLHDCDLDIEWCNFVCYAIAQSFQCPVRCTVHAQSRCSQMPSDSSKNNDVAVGLVTHFGQCCSYDIHWTEEVGLELVSYKVLGSLRCC